MTCESLSALYPNSKFNFILFGKVFDIVFSSGKLTTSWEYATLVGIQRLLPATILLSIFSIHFQALVFPAMKYQPIFSLAPSFLHLKFNLFFYTIFFMCGANFVLLWKRMSIYPSHQHQSSLPYPCLDLCMDWLQLHKVWTSICSCTYTTRKFTAFIAWYSFLSNYFERILFETQRDNTVSSMQGKIHLGTRILSR